MNKEEIRAKIDELKQEILSDIRYANIEQLEKYMYLNSLERIPVELNAEIQQIYKCRFGFINKEGKINFINFSRSSGTGSTTSHRVNIVEEYEHIGTIFITTDEDEKLIGLCEYCGKTRPYVDIVKNIVENYIYRGKDKGWCKK